MINLKKAANLLFVAALALSLCACAGSSYAAESGAAWTPGDDVSMIVAYAPGGSSDLVARAFTNQGASAFATPVVVNNMPGGGNAIGFTALIQAAPDGLTIGNTNSSVVVNTIVSETPYVYYKEIQALVQVGYAPYVVYVNKSSDIMNLDDLKKAILSREVVMAVNSRGGQTHWELEYFALEAGGDITSIIYNGGADAISALMGNHVDVTVQAPADGQEYVRSGDLRAIAVLDSNRLTNEVYSNVATSEEQGYGWLQNGFFHGYSAPKGVSPEIIAYYENAFRAALDNPEVRGIIENYGFTVDFQNHEEFAATWDAEADRYANALAKLGDRLAE